MSTDTNDTQDPEDVRVRECTVDSSGNVIRVDDPPDERKQADHEAYQFLSISLAQMHQENAFASTIPLSPIFNACDSLALLNFANSSGLGATDFELNKKACVGNNPYDRFVTSIKNQNKNDSLEVVFHGTSESNISDILKDGLDPSKRFGQAFGPGEYFSTDPSIAYSYCKGGSKMLVFLVVKTEGESPSASILKGVHRKLCIPPSEIVVVNKIEHQLPLGVLTFHSVSQSGLKRSFMLRSTLQQLNQKIQIALDRARTAKLKSQIIQLIIVEGVDVASEKYGKSQNILDDLSKREISMYVHRHCHSDFVGYYFPDLPAPMTAEEYDNSQVKSVESLEAELKNAHDVFAGKIRSMKQFVSNLNWSRADTSDLSGEQMHTDNDGVSNQNCM